MRSLQHLRALAASRTALSPAAGVAALPAASLAAARGLRASAMCLGLGSHMSDDDPAVLELEKRRNLSKGKRPGGGGVPDVAGWNERLASDSEAVVKAERSGAMTLETLTEFTLKRVDERNHDPIIAEEEREAAAAAAMEPQDRTAG